MYRDYYKLSAKPFRLTPDTAFVSAHSSYRKAQAQMQHALEQGDGILVVTGCPGTGKTTLIENFLARLQPAKVLCATVVGTSLETENLVRMVGYAFGLDAKNLDQATLLCELQEFLTHHAHARALLIIDEAHNLSSEAFEEVRTLLNMSAGPRPLLQIFLVGQEELQARLQTPELQQLHQRIMAVCVLQPLSLQETHDYMLHRLHCAGWRGNPAIGIYTFVLVHRFSQGLPRYISKLCTRLLAHGAQQHRQRLNLDDVVAVISEMQNELLLPLPCESHPGADAPLPSIQDLLKSKALPDAQRVMPIFEERAFLESNPSVVQDTPASVVRAAQQAGNTVITITAESEQTADTSSADAGPNVADSNTQALIWHSAQRYLGIMAQLAISGALALGRGLGHLIAGLRHLMRRSQGLKPVAQTLWIALKNFSSRAWAVLAVALSFCSARLSGIAGRVGTRKIVGYGATLLLVFGGIYLLSGEQGEQHQKPGPTVAAASLPAAQTSEQSPAGEADVTTEEPTLGTTQLAPAIEPQALDSAVPQAAGSSVPQVADSFVSQSTDSSAPQTIDSSMSQVADSSMQEAAEGALPQVADSSMQEAAEGALPQVADSSMQEAAESSVPQVADSSTPPVALRSLTAAASEAGLEQAPDPDPAATVPAAVTEQNEVANTDGAEAASANSAEAARQARIEELLALADRAMARDRLRRPEKKSAWHYYSQVLESDPDNRAAQDGMRHIAARYHELAVIVLQREEFDKAEGLIQRGLSVVVTDSALLALQEEVQRQRQELRAAQEQEELLALRKSEPEIPAPVVDEQPPKSAGLFGTLKRVFSGKKATQ